MREALTLALQGFEGAMVIVSHDRHLLRTTTDDLYLVHGGRVSAFDGDLDDYHKWLLEQDKELSQSGKAEPSGNTVSRKDQKRREAEFRQAMRPLKQKLEKLEARMSKLQAELGEIEQSMGDPELYTEGQKPRLTALLARQGPLKGELEEVEMAWMTLSEELETQEQAFANEP